VAQDPGNIGAHYSLAAALSAGSEQKAAVDHYLKVIALNPRHPEAYRRAGRILCALGEQAQTARLYEEWLRHDPDNPVARHLLAACTGDQIPERASDEYVQRTFDEFSSTFDEVLKRIDYQAPRLIVEAAVRTLPAATGRYRMLDAGCGTGLCGGFLRPYAQRLVGVDLSGAMLERARALAIYDELVQAELTDYLSRQDASFDLIVAADTFIYFGNLTMVFSAAAGALRPGGLLAFTVEKTEQPHGSDGYRLDPHGRYSHTREYIETTLRTAGLNLCHIDTRRLRMDGNQPVQGFYAVGSRVTSLRTVRDGE
jgi:predicted TPR repeat methyltransferase